MVDEGIFNFMDDVLRPYHYSVTLNHDFVVGFYAVLAAGFRYVLKSQEIPFLSSILWHVGKDLKGQNSYALRRSASEVIIALASHSDMQRRLKKVRRITPSHLEGGAENLSWERVGWVSAAWIEAVKHRLYASLSPS